MLPVYVLTRFNIFIKYETGGRHIKGIDTCRDENYLQKRFELFEKFTFKSMCGQSDKMFFWIVLFHDETPEKFKDKIRKYQLELPQFTPYFLNTEECLDFKKLLHDIILQNKSEYILTIRLDNDDAVTKNFICKMKDKSKLCHKNNEEFALFFDDGFQYDLSDKTVSYFRDEKNHFCGLVSQKDKHVLMYDHTKIENSISTFHVAGSNQNRIWMEIIHDTNVANEAMLSKVKYVKNEIDLSQFNFKIDLNYSLLIKIKKCLQLFFRPFITVYRYGFINVVKNLFKLDK